MDAIGQLKENLQKISINDSFREILRESGVQSFIKDTIKNRIQRTGIDGKGERLKTDSSRGGQVYSDFTNILKEKKSGISGITSHVTLTDSGDFWESLRVLIKAESFVTEADFIKTDGHMQRNFTRDYGSQKEFEDAVTSLTQSELESLVGDYIYPRLIKKINAVL